MLKEYSKSVQNSTDNYKYKFVDYRAMLIRLSGYCGALAITALTVRQYTENYSGFLMVIYSALSVAICCFEFVAIHNAQKFYKDKKYFWVFFYVIVGIGSFIFDISGSIGYMSSAFTKSAQEEMIKQQKIFRDRNLSQLRKEQIQSIKSDNKNIHSINNEFLSRGRISKATDNVKVMLSNQKMISSIIEKEENSNSKQMDIKVHPLLSFYTSMSNLLHIDMETIKKWFEVLIATTASCVSILMTGYKSDEEIEEENDLIEIRKKQRELRSKLRMNDLEKNMQEASTVLSPNDDGNDPKGKKPTTVKNNNSEFSVDLSKNGQMASGDHVLKLVMQNEISGCGIAAMAMIFDYDFFKTKSIYSGNYDNNTGTNTKEISDYINSVGLKTEILEFINASSLIEISSNDVLFLCVKTKNDCMHGCLFEKGFVYCPLRGIMPEDNAFKDWKTVCRVELIKCEDIIKWRNNNLSIINEGNNITQQAALASPVLASSIKPGWVRTDSLKSYAQPLKNLNGHPVNAFRNKELVRVNTRINESDAAHDQVDKMGMYKIAMKAKAGESINCPWCSISFTKKTYNHRFCNPSHKDEFWNAINPTRLKAKGKMKGKKKAGVLRVVKKPKLTIVKGA